MRSGAIAVIPAFGNVGLTHAVVRDLTRERHLVRTVVIDNAGDYSTCSDEEVLSPDSNLGWLRGCNLGIAWARAQEPDAAVLLLNNDTRLSRGFVGGLLAASVGRRTGAVGPCYDDHLRHMRCGFDGPAEDFIPRPRRRRVPYLDGTCMLLTPRALERVAGLAEESFGETGWGADIDLCVRIRKAGLHVYVTERAYLNHNTAATAKVVHLSREEYWRRGDAEMRAALAALYGPDWARRTGVSWGRRAAVRLLMRRGGV